MEATDSQGTTSDTQFHPMDAEVRVIFTIECYARVTLNYSRRVFIEARVPETNDFLSVVQRHRGTTEGYKDFIEYSRRSAGRRYIATRICLGED